MDQLLENLPDKPGVYFFKNKDGRILYIGKAADIRKRVKDHFKSSSNIYLKDEILNSKEIIVEYKVTNSEIDALLLEAKLIREYSPLYNIRQKDDSSYPYIVITNEKYPRIFYERKLKEKKTGGTYYGPFVSVKAVKETINFIQQVWKIASCKYKKFPKRKCYKFQIGLCSAPCEDGNVPLKSYLNNIKEVKEFLGGKNKQRIIDEKTELMEKYSQELKFEEAAKLRDQIKALNKTIENYQVYIPQYYIKNSLKEIQKCFNLPEIPVSIEAFDISNIGTEFAVGAMVYFHNGYPDKNNYRRFRIKTIKNRQNDVLMMREVVHRRYSRLLKENKELPNLIIIDGGKTQLSSVIKELTDLKIKINTIAIAKKFDNIYFYENEQIKKINLPESSPALLLIKRIRDEVHRFAIKYHRLIRSKQFKN